MDRQRDDRDRKRGDGGDRDRTAFRERERDRMRERERDRERRDRRSRSPVGSRENRDRNGRRVDRERFDRDVRDSRDARDDVDDELSFERRRIERELRKKEQSYQERLKNWETREARKQKEREKERSKQEMRQKSEAKEVVRLKQFLEDYNDDVDDAKYYKGSALQRKLKEREKEREEDERDRLEEKRELEELRQKLAEEGIEASAEQLTAAHASSKGQHEHIDISLSATITTKEVITTATSVSTTTATTTIRGEFENEHNSKGRFERTPDNALKKEDEFHVKAFTLLKNTTNTSNAIVAPENVINSVTPLSDSQGSLVPASKKAKTSVQDVFNTAEDDESETFAKRRRLPLFDDNTDSNQSSQSNQLKGNSLSAEEKRKQIKNLIDSIPTSKEQLFNYTIDWSIVDTVNKSIKFLHLECILFNLFFRLFFFRHCNRI